MRKQFIKYCTAGGFSTLIHYMVFLLAIKMMFWSPWQATLAGATIGALTAYILNYRYTFSSKIAHRRILPKFLITAGLGVIIQTLIVAGLSQHWHLHYLLAQIIATGVGLILTFIINRFWTFA